MAEPESPPMGRLDAFDVGAKKLTIQTEFFGRPTWRVETKVYLGGELKKVYTQDLDGSGEGELQKLGKEFLRYMARLAGVPRSEVQARGAEMLQRLGIADAAHRYLSQYSRGMLQRIGMAQALVHRPAFLFLDEPTSGLDPNGVLLVRDLI